MFADLELVLTCSLGGKQMKSHLKNYKVKAYEMIQYPENLQQIRGCPDHVVSVWQTLDLSLPVVFGAHPLLWSQTMTAAEPGAVPS